MPLLMIAMIAFLTALTMTAFAESPPEPPAPVESTASNGEALRSWESFFDETLNDFTEEMDIAKEEEKKGILLMFEMDECPFCSRMKKTVLNRASVQDYYKENFRILSVDVEGDLELIDFQGKETTQKEFAEKQFRVRATPVYLFVDLEGKPVKNGRLTGATKDAHEFLLLGKYISEKHNEEMPFARFKRKLRKEANPGSQEAVRE